MSESRSTFLSETSLTSLVSAENIEKISLGMMRIIHKNRGIAEVRARRFFLSSGEWRSLLKDYEVDEIENNDEFAPEQNTRIRLSTMSDFKILSDYINTGDEHAVKSIVVKLMSAGILYEILPNLDIKRDDILFLINQYYNSTIPRIHELFSRFFFKYPKLEKLLLTRADLYTTPKVQVIINKYKTILDRNGNPPTKEQVTTFTADLANLRADLKNLYDPPAKNIFNLFGLSPQMYTRKLRRAQDELGQMLKNS